MQRSHEMHTIIPTEFYRNSYDPFSLDRTIRCFTKYNLAEPMLRADAPRFIGIEYLNGMNEMTDPFGLPRGPLLDPLGNPFWIPLGTPFGSPWGPLLDPLGDPFWIPLGTPFGHPWGSLCPQLGCG